MPDIYIVFYQYRYKFVELEKKFCIKYDELRMTLK